MRQFLVSLLILLGAISLPVVSAGACELVGNDTLRREMAQATNAMRARSGRPPLHIDPVLTRTAQKHACDIAARQTITHSDARGRLPMKRLKSMGYRACFTAENLAMGMPAANATIVAWQNSPKHAQNHQDVRARAMGFGVARGPKGRLWWVGLYATSCG